MRTGWSAADVPDLTGRVAVVTGANRGLGREITRYLAGHGARVVMACRDEKVGAATADELRTTGVEGALEVRPLDLGSLASVEAFAASLAGEPRLDLLANNAGLMAVDRGLTADGFETHMGVNHLGPFALTGRLLPLLRSTPGSRVVTMSSRGARLGHVDLGDLLWERRPYDRWQAYFQSKLANLLFTFELDRRLRAQGATPGGWGVSPRQGRREPPTTAALAAHPGGARTSLGRNGRSWTNRIVPLWQPFLQPASYAALGFVRAATDPAAQGGQYYGPALQAWGPPIRERPSRQARDPELAAGLWAISERLTGLTF
jgi:NAD(P)-dependent dehydrogenase (short-subunit alcohol dehydrogenase family)